MLQLEHLAELYHRHADLAQAPVQEFSLGNRPFAFNSQVSLMGAINLSPDSWYRESVCLTSEAALARARVLAAQGAHLIDLGAESTLAQASQVSPAGQLGKIIPLVSDLAKEGLVLSVETYHESVARAALQAGAALINLTGVEGSGPIFEAVAEHGAGVIICYLQGSNVRQVGDFDLQSDPIPLMSEFFARQIDRATKLGVRKILIDPGLGFYYRNLQDSRIRIEHQMRVFLNTFRLRDLGWPICHALPHAFECFQEEVRSAEPFFAVLAALGKTSVFRTHEIPKVKAVLETMGKYE